MIMTMTNEGFERLTWHHILNSKEHKAAHFPGGQGVGGGTGHGGR